MFCPKLWSPLLPLACTVAIYVNTHTPWGKFSVAPVIRKSQVVLQEYFFSNGSWSHIKEP